MTIAVPADVTGFLPNPPIADESYTYDVNWEIAEGLVRFGPRLDVQPALAEHWMNPDDRTYLFHLRPGIKFSDGQPLVADDVVASLRAAMARRWVTRAYLQAIESVQAVDKDTVEIRTRFPYHILLAKLPWGFVLPASALAQAPVPLIGTGPYRLESWRHGEEFVLARNPHFRGPAAGFARARFVVVPKFDDRITGLLAGRFDVADSLPPASTAGLRDRKDIRVFSGPGVRVLFLGLRVDRAPFSDPRVREALDIALDREELIARAYDGGTVPAAQLVPAAVVGYVPEIGVTRPDRARARRLLAAAGYGSGLHLRLDGPTNRYVNDRRILDEVARQLGELGIRVEVNALDKKDLFPKLFGGHSVFHLLGWQCQSAEAGQALDSLVHSPTGGMLGSANTTGIADAELDRLIEAAHRSQGSAERARALQAATARVARLRPVLPLLVQAEGIAISRRVAWEPPLNYALRVSEMRPAAE